METSFFGVSLLDMRFGTVIDPPESIDDKERERIYDTRRRFIRDHCGSIPENREILPNERREVSKWDLVGPLGERR